MIGTIINTFQGWLVNKAVAGLAEQMKTYDESTEVKEKESMDYFEKTRETSEKYFRIGDGSLALEHSKDDSAGAGSDDKPKSSGSRSRGKSSTAASSKS